MLQKLLTVALASLVASAAAAGPPFITNAKVKRSKNLGNVIVRVEGRFDPEEFDPTHGVEVQVGFGFQAISESQWKTSSLGSEIHYKGDATSFVKSAKFDLAHHRFKLELRSTSPSEYTNPLALGVVAKHRYEFDIPIDETQKASVFEGTLFGSGGGSPLGAATFDSNGGSHAFGPVLVQVDAGTIVDPIRVELYSASQPAALPAGTTPLGGFFEVAISSDHGRNPFELPLRIESKLPLASFQPGQSVGILRFDFATNRWAPTTLLAADALAQTVAFETRVSSIFTVVRFDWTPPQAFDVSNFTPSANGWSIPNNGISSLDPGGYCLGMASYATWFFDSHTSQNHLDTYTGLAAPMLALRAQFALRTYWVAKCGSIQSSLDAAALGLLMKEFLATFDEPFVMVMSGSGGSHAAVCHGYDAQGFLLYDVDSPGADFKLPWDSTAGFGTYRDFDAFGYIAISSLGRQQDFESLYRESASGFNGSFVVVDSPATGATIQAATVKVKGHVEPPSWNSITTLVNGVKQSNQLKHGRFNLDVPLTPGTNSIVVLAGVDLDQQSAFAAGSGLAQTTIQGDTPDTDLLVTLTWDQDETDLDLYTYEPNTEVAWYHNFATSSGGVLAMDDSGGYGPEQYIGGVAESGIYKIRVHYYSDAASSLPASGVVSILINKGKPNQAYATRTFIIQASDPENDSPESDGPDWVDIADVDVVGGAIVVHG